MKRTPNLFLFPIQLPVAKPSKGKQNKVSDLLSTTRTDLENPWRPGGTERVPKQLILEGSGRKESQLYDLS